MQRRERQVARLGDPEGRLDRLEVAHFADQHDVGVLAQHGAQGVREGVRVGVELALVDEALLVAVKELDRVLDRHDVELLLAVDLVDHRRLRRRLARARRPADEDQAARLVAEELDDRRQTQLLEAEDLVGNLPVDAADRAALHEVVGPEAGQALDAEREVELEVLLEAVLLGVGQNRVGELLGLGDRQRRVRERDELAVQAHHRRRLCRQMEVGSPHLDHLLQEPMERGLTRHTATPIA